MLNLKPNGLPYQRLKKGSSDEFDANHSFALSLQRALQNVKNIRHFHCANNNEYYEAV